MKEEGIEKGSRETIVVISFHYNTIFVKIVENWYGLDICGKLLEK